MAVYPATLPAPLLDGYEVSKNAPFIRTEMESGIARQRRRFIATPVEINFSIACFGEQIEQFMTFYNTTLIGGTAFFSMSLDIGNGSQTYHQVRFKEGYKLKKIAHQTWNVSAMLEVIV